MSQKARCKRDMPSSYTIILLVLVAIAVATLVVSRFVPGVKPATLADVTMAFPNGFVDAASISIFVMTLGGLIAIVQKSGALDRGIQSLVAAMGGNELALIPILMFVYSILGTTFGFCEETVGFYALMAATMMAAGTDTLTGAAMILLGAGTGVVGSTVNPFAIGVACDSLSAAGIQTNQAVILALGVILWLGSLAISILYVWRYAVRVKRDRGRSLLSGHEVSEARKAYGHAAESTGERLTRRQGVVLALFGLTFFVMILGFIPWQSLGVPEEILSWSSVLASKPLGQWYFGEATAWFFIMCIVTGLVAGLSERDLVDTFVEGASSMVGVILVIGLARGVANLMQATGLTDAILAAAATGLKGLSAYVFAPLSYLLYLGVSFLIPSSSGLATVSMPVMGPLAKELGFSPSVMVQIFSSANALVNMVTPTCGAIMGGLALARVEFGTWIRFSLKLMGMLVVFCMAVLTVACLVVHV